MAYRSKLKERYFHYLESKGKMPKMSDEDTENAQGYAHGGMVDDGEDLHDYEMGHEDELVSSGEPHTEDHFEDEQPMEYMSDGGKVREPQKYRDLYRNDRAAEQNKSGLGGLPRHILDRGYSSAGGVDLLANDEDREEGMIRGESRDPSTEDWTKDGYYRGGKVRRMANGGMIKSPGFVQALRKKMY